MNMHKTIEGKLRAENLKFAIIATRTNSLVVEPLVNGATDFLVRHGASLNDITTVKVPGAFEIPKIAKFLTYSKKFHGLICLGAIIRGDTLHFEMLAHECSKSLSQINLETDLPIGFGVLATDTLEQALERAGAKGGNKGTEAAEACLEMIDVIKQLQKTLVDDISLSSKFTSKP